MKVTYWKLSDIKPYPGNPRQNDQAVEAVAASIREFDFRQPIVVDNHGVIVVGHTRYLAALRLGRKTPGGRGLQRCFVGTRGAHSPKKNEVSSYNLGMALIVFLRGVNVGGHRTFRPSILARELSDYDVVNVGAAGTFVVRKPGSQAKFRAELLRKLPFQTEVALCDGRDLIRLETENPFGTEPARPDIVRFVTILSRAGRPRAPLPIAFPPDGEWLLRVIAAKNRFVFGVYRRHMKTIGYLGQIDKLFGVPVTTRNWNTIMAVVRILKRTKTYSE